MRQKSNISDVCNLSWSSADHTNSSNTKCSQASSDVTRKLPPVFDPPELPPLPPTRRERELKAQLEPPPKPLESIRTIKATEPPRRPVLPPRLTSKSTTQQVQKSTEQEDAPKKPRHLPPPPSCYVRSQPQSIGHATQQEQSSPPLWQHEEIRTGAASNVPPPAPLNSQPGFAEVGSVSGKTFARVNEHLVCHDLSKPDVVAAQYMYPRLWATRNNELGSLAQEFERYMLDQGTHSTALGNDGRTSSHELWEATAPETQTAGVVTEYTVNRTYRLLPTIQNSLQSGIEFIAGSQFAWWPLPQPEDQPKQGFTRVYSLRSPTWPWKTRRFYDISTPTAEKIFPKLGLALRSSGQSRWAALQRMDIVLQNTTLMGVLQHLESSKEGDTREETPGSAGAESAVLKDTKGKNPGNTESQRQRSRTSSPNSRESRRCQ